MYYFTRYSAIVQEYVLLKQYVLLLKVKSLSTANRINLKDSNGRELKQYIIVEKSKLK